MSAGPASGSRRPWGLPLSKRFQGSRRPRPRLLRLSWLCLLFPLRGLVVGSRHPAVGDRLARRCLFACT